MSTDSSPKVDDLIPNLQVAEVFASYPPHMRKNLLTLRRLIFETAAETDGVGVVEETLKWGEPSYLVNGGATIRMAWKSSNPEQYALYFHCKTKLIDTFKEIYADQLRFSGNRAIIFSVSDKIPVKVLKHCIALSLTYHRRKKVPMLGV